MEGDGRLFHDGCVGTRGLRVVGVRGATSECGEVVKLQTVVCVRGGKLSSGQVRHGRMWGCDDGRREDVTWGCEGVRKRTVSGVVKWECEDAEDGVKWGCEEGGVK